MNIIKLQEQIEAKRGMAITYLTRCHVSIDYADDVLSDALIRGIEAPDTPIKTLILESARKVGCEHDSARRMRQLYINKSDESNGGTDYMVELQRLHETPYKTKIHDYPDDFLQQITPRMRKLIDLDNDGVSRLQTAKLLKTSYSNVVTELFHIRRVLWQKYRKTGTVHAHKYPGERYAGWSIPTPIVKYPESFLTLLTPLQRTYLELHGNGHTRFEIAKLTARTPPNVSSSMYRIRLLYQYWKLFGQYASGFTVTELKKALVNEEAKRAA
jgi:DNA-directed RNA polymerase specialized sigma24 family protein